MRINKYALTFVLFILGVSANENLKQNTVLNFIEDFEKIKNKNEFYLTTYSKFSRGESIGDYSMRVFLKNDIRAFFKRTFDSKKIVVNLEGRSELEINKVLKDSIRSKYTGHFESLIKLFDKYDINKFSGRYKNQTLVFRFKDGYSLGYYKNGNESPIEVGEYKFLGKIKNKWAYYKK